MTGMLCRKEILYDLHIYSNLKFKYNYKQAETDSAYFSIYNIIYKKYTHHIGKALQFFLPALL